MLGFGKTVPISRERLRANCDYLMTYVRDEAVEIQLSNGSVFPCKGAGTWFLPPGVEHTIRLAGGGAYIGFIFRPLVKEWWSFDRRPILNSPSRVAAPIFNLALERFGGLMCRTGCLSQAIDSLKWQYQILLMPF